nr:cobalamin biosynthesis protein [Desulfospira joergensenii]
MAVWAITPNGQKLGIRICSGIGKADLFISEKIENGPETGKPSYPLGRPENINIFSSLSREIKRRFQRYEKHVFIFSTGIAVRMISPLLQSKLADPAVVVIDDQGNHVISLISGHLGGANELARDLARRIQANPVITTATDVNQLPSIDMIAKRCNLFIETPENIKRINMAFLTDKKILLKDPGSFIRKAIPKKFLLEDETDKEVPRIHCSWKTEKVSRETMILRPRVLSIGMGCNRNTPFEIIRDFFNAIMAGENLSLDSLVSIATTEIKKDEKGLLRLSETLGVPIKFYDKTSLNSVKTIENPSKMVEKHLGVKSVCEAAAILAANNGKLIVPKKKNRDVTLAVALEI